MVLLRKYIRGLLESTKHDEQFKTLMDAGYDGIKQAIFLAASRGIPSQDLPWDIDSVDAWVWETSGWELTDETLKPTGWNIEDYENASRKQKQSHDYEPSLGYHELKRLGLREDTHTFHGYKFGPDKVGLPGPNFDDTDFVTDDDVDDAVKWLDQYDPSELVAFSRGSAVLHQVMDKKPEKWRDKEIPKITYVSPASLRKWTGAPVPSDIPGGSKVVHSMGDDIVPLKQACQVAAQTGADMHIVPGKADGKDHVRALRYRDRGGKVVHAAACALDDDLPDWGDAARSSEEELEQQMQRGKALTGEHRLREYISSLLSTVVTDPRDTPPEKEFVDGPDVLAGYIVVRDSHDHNMIAYAPITRTDGPDRPYLVRTTDTHWEIPFGIVRVLYPQVEDVFNQVDSKEDWNNLGIGDRGEVGGFEWEWVDVKPTA